MFVFGFWREINGKYVTSNTVCIATTKRQILCEQLYTNINLYWENARTYFVHILSLFVVVVLFLYKDHKQTDNQINTLGWIYNSSAISSLTPSPAKWY